MFTIAEATSGRPRVLCAAIATLLLACSLTFVDAVTGPRLHAAAATSGFESRLDRASTGAGDFTRPQAGAEGGGLSLGIAEVIEPSNVAELKVALERVDFQLTEIRDGAAEVPRLYVATLPPDLSEIGQIETRKQVFLGSVLPLILLANEELRQRRGRLLDLANRIEAGAEISLTDWAWLDALAEHYGLAHGDLAGLTLRVDEIPPSLALAQAIVESGWGTSRFALKGNALFGQRTWSAEALAIVPELNRGVRVKAFIDLMDSVRAYMHNLNSHQAYGELRRERARLAAAGKRPGGGNLVHGLERYAEIDGYVGKLRALMRHNRLAELDDAELKSRPLTAFAAP
ncbi:glucosaminidase domain-containing protein [Algihabitans albus]|uniref:glucosaminidase domain-containing protein n=1 Tax=Algihabitans albus TaxID=2164067 RepID=UPI000E5CDF90|nr:glucosaminidase domain-containing protein [Algihabitans albus]